MATQLERLEELLSQQERSIQRAFNEFIASVNDETVIARLVALVEAGRVDDALAIIDTYVARFADVLPRIQQTVGAATALELSELASEYIFGIGFDPSHPRAATFARANRLELVRQFTEEQRVATRQALGRAFEQGTGTAGTARAFRNSIGLTRGQEAWVASFENRLRALDARALGMELRNHRWDKTILRAIQRRRPLTERQIEMMTRNYRLRALMYRSEMIARTEALRATSAARHEAMLQMMGMTNIPPERVRRKWNYTRDERVRDHHANMRVDRAGVDENFVDGLGNELLWPGDPAAPPETTIHCRCTVTYSILPPPK